MTPEEQRRAIQRRNAVVVALLLGLFVVLMFAISIAKIGLGWSK